MIPPLWTRWHNDSNMHSLPDDELDYQAFLRRHYSERLAIASKADGQAGRTRVMDETLSLADGLLESEKALPLQRAWLTGNLRADAKRATALDMLSCVGRLRQELLALIDAAEGSESEFAERARGLLPRLDEHEEAAQEALQKQIGG